MLYFQKFGEVAEHVWDEATPALVIQFKTRKDAETAMAKGRNFQDRLMSVTWFNPTQSMGMRYIFEETLILTSTVTLFSNFIFHLHLGICFLSNKHNCGVRQMFR